MPLVPSSVKRSTDASGDDILTLRTDDGKQVQAVVAVDDAGAPIVPGQASQLEEIKTQLAALALAVAGLQAVVEALQKGTADEPVMVTGFPETQPVSGSVNVGNFPATQAVSGSVEVGNLAAEYGTNDVAEAGAIIYAGKETPAGAWLVQKIDATSGTVIRFASAANNPSVTTYAVAWAGRTGLTYGTWSEVA